MTTGAVLYVTNGIQDLAYLLKQLLFLKTIIRRKKKKKKKKKKKLYQFIQQDDTIIGNYLPQKVTV